MHGDGKSVAAGAVVSTVERLTWLRFLFPTKSLGPP